MPCGQCVAAGMPARPMASVAVLSQTAHAGQPLSERQIRRSTLERKSFFVAPFFCPPCPSPFSPRPRPLSPGHDRACPRGLRAAGALRRSGGGAGQAGAAGASRTMRKRCQIGWANAHRGATLRRQIPPISFALAFGLRLSRAFETDAPPPLRLALHGGDHLPCPRCSLAWVRNQMACLQVLQREGYA